MIANKLKIDGTEYDLPSGASAVVEGDNLIINNGNATSYDVHVSNFEYSTDERVVGCWTDGKPIYEKTFVNFQLVNNKGKSTYSYNLNIPDGDKSIKLEFLDQCIIGQSRPFAGADYAIGAWINYIDNQIYLTFETGIDRSNMTVSFILQYTKTTDLPNSFKPSMLNIKSIIPQHNYSTEEKAVGTWIDGRTIYEKTVEIPELPNNTRINISPCDGTLIDAKGYCYSKMDPTSIRLIPFAAGGVNDIRVDQTEGYIRVWTFADWRTYAAYVTYQYLKD